MLPIAYRLLQHCIAEILRRHWNVLFPELCGDKRNSYPSPVLFKSWLVKRHQWQIIIFYPSSAIWRSRKIASEKRPVRSLFRFPLTQEFLKRGCEGSGCERSFPGSRRLREAHNWRCSLQMDWYTPKVIRFFCAGTALNLARLFWWWLPSPTCEFLCAGVLGWGMKILPDSGD